MSKSDLPPIYDLETLRSSKLFLKARINQHEVELKRRASKVTGFFSKNGSEDGESPGFVNILSTKAFDIIYDLLIGVRGGKLGMFRGMMWTLKAQLFRAPLKALWSKLVTKLPFLQNHQNGHLNNDLAEEELKHHERVHVAAGHP